MTSVSANKKFFFNMTSYPCLDTLQSSAVNELACRVFWCLVFEGENGNFVRHVNVGYSVSCSNITSTNKALVQTQDASDIYTAKICWPPPTDTPDNASNQTIALTLNHTFTGRKIKTVK
ncbi:hypothetical protein TcasGA2_TC004019 [Tribolium castaneum]|uniref:Uncharacterized protein n=1 Tax=Tribolium castaneum TaxID=7070 RepID=D6WIU6_TRICA|nr:hypothetical protein TcasGA2_TC004019 [Tribolium castaneum]